jgi:hypothetical protein
MACDRAPRLRARRLGNGAPACQQL